MTKCIKMLKNIANEHASENPFRVLKKNSEPEQERKLFNIEDEDRVLCA